MRRPEALVYWGEERSAAVTAAADKTIQWIVLSDERRERKRRAGEQSRTTPRAWANGRVRQSRGEYCSRPLFP